MKNRIINFIATGAYLGYSRFMPGTLGTLWGVLLAWGASLPGLVWQGAITAAVCAGAAAISGRAARLFNEKDPKQIVIDETAGFLVAVFLLPFTALNMIIAFILFRFFDIVKPWPVGLIDKKVGGGTGIVLDDVAAGVMANLCAQAAIRIIQWAA